MNLTKDFFERVDNKDGIQEKKDSNKDDSKQRKRGPGSERQAKVLRWQNPNLVFLHPRENQTGKQAI